MKKLRLVFMAVICTAIFSYNSIAQEEMFSDSKISGNFQLDVQSYEKDSVIGADAQDEKVLSNGFFWLNYSSSNFNAGMRYENYMNPILGIDERYKGNGLAFRFAEFTSEVIDVRAGNFYEQFGSGMIFRTYQDFALGYDNSVDGLRVKFRPTEGIEIKGLIGKQRKFWIWDGLLRGGDINIDLNESLPDLLPDEYQLSLGGSVISKFQADQESKYNLPENVLSWASRISLIGSSFSVDAEYGYKNPDPSLANSYNFNPGNALLVNASYFQEGLGLSVNFHKNDNMDIRSDRSERQNVLLMNFLPPLSKQHTYALAAMYPYATQLNGEIGFMAEATYTIPRKTLIGGDYGTTINLNFSQVNSIVKNPTFTDSLSAGDAEHVFTYDSPFFEFGDRVYYRELHVEISRKFSKDVKTVFTYLNQLFDESTVEHTGSSEYGHVHNDVVIADITYKFSSQVALRIEAQHMWHAQDSAVVEGSNRNGNWAMGLAELTVSPHWYISIADQYNYGNKFEEKKVHYVSTSLTYVVDATRVSFGFGRQREGILCVGGVCRTVPASNGFFMSVSSSF